MKACFIRRYGGNDVVEFSERPIPQPSPGQLLVKVHAAGVNPVDYKIRDGALKPILPLALPLVLGSELSGVVHSVGPGVPGFAPGDAVFARLALLHMGAYAEYAVVDAEHAARKPENLSHVQAAAVPLAALTAWQALFERGQLKAGQSVLVHGGSGGVGSFAIQLAKHAGATVATTVGARNAALATELGADVVIDYRAQRFEEVVRGCDLVLDTQAGETQHRSFAVLKPGGRLVSVAGMPDRAFAQVRGLNPALGWLFHFMNRKSNRLAKATGTRFEYLFMRPSGAQLAQLAELLEAGHIRPVIDKVFPLAQTADALAYCATGRVTGKVVIET